MFFRRQVATAAYIPLGALLRTGSPRLAGVPRGCLDAMRPPVVPLTPEMALAAGRQGGGPLLQGQDGRVILEHVIPKGGRDHGLLHPGSGSGDGVASEIDDRRSVHGERLSHTARQVASAGRRLHPGAPFRYAVVWGALRRGVE